MKRRVAILHQGFIPTYRVRFFELINQNPDIEYVVFHGAPPSGIGARAATGPFNFPNVVVKNHEITLRSWTMIYQPVIRQILFGGFDAVVLGHELKFPSNIALAILGKARGIAVLFWGFGYHVSFGPGLSSRPPGGMSRIATPIKNILTRLADGYLVYTQGGADNLAKIGLPPQSIFVLRNTVDVTAQIALHAKAQETDPATLRARFGLRPDSVVLLYIGRLVEAKKVDQLIEATKRLNQNNPAQTVETIIIGTGPMEKALRAQAAEAGHVQMMGEIYDQEIAAAYMRVASAVVIPGFVGLAVNHALAQGRPVITRQHGMHSPEIEYVKPGENGLIIDGDMDAFVAALARFAADPEQRQRLAAGALASRDDLRIEVMAEQFNTAVSQTITRKRR